MRNFNEKTMLVDSHCHLDYLKQDLNQVITSATKAGVKHLLTVGTSCANAKVMQDICAKYNNVDCAIGVHPLELTRNSLLSLEWLQTESAKSYVVAVGETGLDYHYQQQNSCDQQASFELHLDCAKINGLPVIVHTREAKQDTLRLLRQAHLPHAGVLHCFTEDWEMAKKALDLGFYISFSGIVTFKNSYNLRQIAGQVPIERILVETDAPYLAPHPYRGKTNLPQYVVETAKFIANLRHIDYEEFGAQTTANFKRLFVKARV